MRFVLVGGNTNTAPIDGISAAGANPDAMVHTPSGDLEIVEYGHPMQAPVVPVSPTGCPTPAVLTRAVRELLEFDVLAVGAGLARPTTAPAVTIGAEVGNDLRTSHSVASASDTFEVARRLGCSLPDDELVIGETTPGGTTTALGVLTALGEQPTVSSSLPANPLSLKRDAVNEALNVSGDNQRHRPRAGRGTDARKGANARRTGHPSCPPDEFGPVQALWGDGKGKTTAAMGMGFRATGHSYRVHVLQFTKGGASSVEDVRGEYNAIAAA